MKTLIAFSIFLVGLASLAETLAAPANPVTVGNKLQAFTSDGCSWFPDGLLVTDKNKWLHCCIEHDVAYWKGGTSEEKKAADQHLGQCVAKTGERLIGKAMALGVRGGGAADLPTTFHWGYGWVQYRGYAPLNDDELKQVAALTPQMREIVSSLQIQTPPLIPATPRMTNSLCVDRAIVATEKFLGHEFRLTRATETRKQTAEGTLLTVALETDECTSALTYQFLLLRANACETATNELAFRSHVILRTPKLKCEPPK
jgi:hypothetical protein